MLLLPGLWADTLQKIKKANRSFPKADSSFVPNSRHKILHVTG
jgi:hypothetical protein